MDVFLSGKFWVGLILGAALYHFYLMKMKKANG